MTFLIVLFCFVSLLFVRWFLSANIFFEFPNIYSEPNVNERTYRDDHEDVETNLFKRSGCVETETDPDTRSGCVDR